mmetsp:Transcript_36880/g.90756  ORF Transcript_36880/g.90756 Transcript_36880/m.90756 type:complete len:261 (-) Transcript_36880:324-1106(-)
MLYSRASGAQAPGQRTPTIFHMPLVDPAASLSPRGRKRSPLAEQALKQPVLLNGRPVTAGEVVATVQEQRRLIAAMEASTTDGATAQLRKLQAEMSAMLAQEREARAQREAQLTQELSLVSKELDTWRTIPAAHVPSEKGEAADGQELKDMQAELDRVKKELRGEPGGGEGGCGEAAREAAGAGGEAAGDSGPGEQVLGFGDLLARNGGQGRQAPGGRAVCFPPPTNHLARAEVQAGVQGRGVRVACLRERAAARGAGQA